MAVDFQVFIETLSRTSASPQQCLKVNFHIVFGLRDP